MRRLRAAFRALPGWVMALAGALVVLAAAAVVAVRFRAPQFRPGDRWAYRTRPVEPGSTVLVLASDVSNGTQVVHVALEHLHIRNPRARDGVTEAIQHVPLSPRALAQSVTHRVATRVQLPDFAEAYARWKAEGAGAFDEPLAAVVDSVERRVGGGAPQPASSSTP